MSRDLSKLHPYVKCLAEKLIAEAKRQGVDIVVTSTLRTMDEQSALYAQGRTKPGSKVTNCKAGQSSHNYALAFDIAVKNKDGKTINWSGTADTDKDGKKDWYEVGAIGKSLGLTWGGDFKTILDMPHFEWTGGLNLKDLQAGKKPQNPLEKTVLSIKCKRISTATIELQKLLNKKGYSCGVVDGIFGNKTLAAVKAFQGVKKLTVTGIVDATTWAYLF